MKILVFKNPAAINPKAECRMIIHAGKFHPDDLAAVLVAMLIYGTVQVFRVTEVKTEHLKPNGGRTCYIVDIGERYDGKTWFDHHQDIELYADGVKPCGASLFAKAVMPSDIFEYFYEKVLRPVAVQDNGQADLIPKYPNLLFGWVSSMNPLWDSEETPDEAFEKAVNIGFPIMKQQFDAFVSKNRAESVLEKAEELEGGKILVLPQYVPWLDYAVAKKEALFVIHPSNRGGYMAQCVPPTAEDWTHQRQPFPVGWRNGEQPEGCTFCHKNLFCAAFETQEQAVAAVKALL